MPTTDPVLLARSAYARSLRAGHGAVKKLLGILCNFLCAPIVCVVFVGDIFGGQGAGPGCWVLSVAQGTVRRGHLVVAGK